MTVLYQCGWMLCSSLVCFNTQSLISLCFTVVHCKPINQCKDITCLNVTFTATHCSTGKSKAVALAPATALRLATDRLFSATPLYRILCFWFMYCWLTPDATLHSREPCYICRHGTSSRHHHLWWFSTGEQLATDNRTDIWRLCTTGCPTYNTCLL